MKRTRECDTQSNNKKPRLINTKIQGYNTFRGEICECFNTDCNWKGLGKDCNLFDDNNYVIAKCQECNEYIAKIRYPTREETKFANSSKDLKPWFEELWNDLFEIDENILNIQRKKDPLQTFELKFKNIKCPRCKLIDKGKNYNIGDIEPCHFELNCPRCGFENICEVFFI